MTEAAPGATATPAPTGGKGADPRGGGVVQTFGGIRAVNGATFDVERESITALIGPNGAGKTTCFNVLTGFYAGNRGSVRFDGEEVFSEPAHRIARRGMVRTFQITKALSRMPVIDNMLLAGPDQPGEKLFNNLIRRGASKAREAEIHEQALELLEEFNLAKLQDEYAGTLSGGQRKLLELARALMTKPRLLMLDEPMAGINPTLGARLLRAHGAPANRGWRHVPLRRARHGSGDEPLRSRDRDGGGQGDRRRRCPRRSARTSA